MNLLHFALACWLSLALAAQDLAVEVAPVPGLAKSRITCIEESRDGRIWFGGRTGLWCDDGQITFELQLPIAIGQRQHVHAMAPAADGGLLVGLSDGLYHVPSGARTLQLVRGTESHSVRSVVADEHGWRWLRTSVGLMRRAGNGQLETVTLPDGSQVAGMASGGRSRWIWSTDTLWYGAGIKGPLRRLAQVEIVAAAADQDGLVFCSSEGVGRFQVDGALAWLGAEILGSQVIPREGGVWVCGASELHWIPRNGSGPQRVHLFRERAPADDLTLHTIEIDSDGLVWLGQEMGAMRLSFCEGIENIRVPLLAFDARVTAIAESPDGDVWLGTSKGQLVRRVSEEAGGWFEVPLPHRGKPISAIIFDATGALCVAHWRDGVWRRSANGWQRLESVATRGARGLAVHDGQLFGCGNHEVWRERADGVLEVLALTGGAPGAPPALPRSFAKSDAGLLLATHRGGLFRFDASSGSFVHFGLTDSVINVVAIDDVVYAATVADLWRIGPGLAAERVPLSGNDPFRSMSVAGNDVLWVARSGMLQSLEDGVVRQMSGDSGAHPLGYTFLSRALCADGGVLLGARGGYTRLYPNASARAAERARIGGSWVIDAAAPGVRMPLEPGRSSNEVRGDSFRVEVQIIDRARGVRTDCKVLVKCETSDVILLGRAGEFVVKQDGDYRVLAVFREATGAPRSVELGRVRIVRPGAPWVLAGWVALGCLPFLVWGIRHWRRQLRLLRARSLPAAELAAVLGGESDEVLDIAFLVVAAAESAANRADMASGGVWLAVRGKPRFLLASLGGDFVQAEGWLERGLRNGQVARPGVLRHEDGGSHDLIIVLEAEDALRFNVVVRSQTPWTDEALDALLRELEPARGALARHVWLSRLQSHCVRSGMMLEAGLHDLRGPLTALQFGMQELREDHCELDPTIQGLSQATECLIRAVDQLQAPSKVELVEADIAAMVVEIVSGLGARAAERRIDLRVNASEDGTLRACVDEVWLRRAVLNVVGNALKYSETGSVVEVAVRPLGRDVLVVVDDEGPGICAEDLDYVFLPGGTGRSAPRNGEEQTGIGLWVSRQAVRAMGGRMWIEASPVGGTRVNLSLPCSSVALT